MIRKEKPRKKQHFRRKETNDVQLKRKRKEPKQKYRNVKVWIEEEME